MDLTSLRLTRCRILRPEAAARLNRTARESLMRCDVVVDAKLYQ